MKRRAKNEPTYVSGWCSNGDRLHRKCRTVLCQCARHRAEEQMRLTDG